MLIDGAIYELDMVLYHMGIHKIKIVKGYTTHRFSHLPKVMKIIFTIYESAETGKEILF